MRVNGTNRAKRTEEESNSGLMDQSTRATGRMIKLMDAVD